MHIVCPHCRNPVELAPEDSAPELLCPSCGSSFRVEGGSTVPLHLPNGQRQLGRFELVDTVGVGAFGTVFMARDRELDRVVAIKVPRAGNLLGEEHRQRFLREARSVARLRHPAIVPVYEVGEQDGLPYLVSQFVRGVTLADLLSARRPPPAEAARLVAALADAVQYAHDQGVIHRDIKPSNVLLDEAGEPHLMDFGLAKRDAGEVTVTLDGQVLGTPAYMSPEQAQGDAHTVDGRSDVYSLGVVLYQLLTGELPFRGTSRMLLHQVLHEEPPPPRRLAPGIPRDLETVCLRAMAKEPGRRYQAAADLAADLRRFLRGEPVVARRTGPAERLVLWARRRPAAAGLLAVSGVAVLALLLLAGGWSVNARLQAALQAAEEQRQLAEERLQEVERQRARAEASLEEARRQRELATTNFQKRLEVVDDILTRMDGRLAQMEGMDAVRMEFLTEAVRLNADLLQEYAGDPSVRRQAGRVHRSLGDLHRDRGSARDALPAYEQAVAIQQGLAAEFPGRTDYRNDLAITQAHRGELLVRSRRFPEARAALEQAIRLQGELASASPGQADYPVRRAYYRFLLANLLEEAGEPKAAEAAYLQALAEQEKLTAEFPKRPDCQQDLAATATSLAVLLEGTDPAAAWAWWERSLAARRAARQLSGPGSPRGLQDAYFDVAAFCKRQGRHAELARLAVALRGDFPASANDTYNASCFLADAAGVARGGDDAARREAAGYAERAVGLLRRAVELGYDDPVHLSLDTDLDPLRGRADFRELAQALGRRHPDRVPTPARRVAALRQQFENSAALALRESRQARTVAGRKRARSHQPSVEAYAGRFLRLAEGDPSTAPAAAALAWVIEHTDPAKAGTRAEPLARLREQALRLVERDHLQRDEVAAVCDGLATAPSPEGDRLLRALADKHASASVRGHASYSLGLSLARQAERARPKEPGRAEELARQAEGQLEQVVKEHAGVPHGKGTLREAAAAKLYELAHLTAGRPAAETEGEDLDGRPLRLSDYRGKVVVLDFWANWCGFCRQMYPRQREMVRRWQDRPFALLGVNGDDDKAVVRRVVEKERLAWRSWWDGGRGGGRLAAQWQVDAFPTVYVLDHKGVIRYKYAGTPGAELEKAVETLLGEAEAGQRRAGK